MGAPSSDSVSFRIATARRPVVDGDVLPRDNLSFGDSADERDAVASPTGKAAWLSDSSAGISLPRTVKPPSPSSTSPDQQAASWTTATTSAEKPIGAPVASRRTAAEAIVMFSSSPTKCLRAVQRHVLMRVVGLPRVLRQARPHVGVRRLDDDEDPFLEVTRQPRWPARSTLETTSTVGDRSSVAAVLDGAADARQVGESRPM